MKINNIEVKEILEFPAAPAFGKYKRFFPKEAVAHPAKAHVELLEYLILNYTKEGEHILDPMAGTFSTVIIAMLNNRNGIGVELEERFWKWGKEAIRNVMREQTLTPKGKGIAIKGDARRLKELMGNIGNLHFADSMIFSSPYGEAHPKENLDCVLFSPPYADTISRQGGDSRISDIGTSCKAMREYSADVENIGNLPLGIDTAIFSPPYSLGHDSGDNASAEYAWRLNEQRKHTRAYSNRNIAKLPISDMPVDACLFSPPYESSLEGTSRHTKGGIASRGQSPLPFGRGLRREAQGQLVD